MVQGQLQLLVHISSTLLSYSSGEKGGREGGRREAWQVESKKKGNPPPIPGSPPLTHLAPPPPHPLLPPTCKNTAKSTSRVTAISMLCIIHVYSGQCSSKIVMLSQSCLSDRDAHLSPLQLWWGEREGGRGGRRESNLSAYCIR